MLLLFKSFFLILLILHVSLDYLFVNSNRGDLVASCPKVIAPIGLMLHLRVTLEQFDRKLTFQCAHQFRDTYFRGNRNHKMNMILFNAHLLNIASLPFTQHAYIFFQQGIDLAFQDPKPILGYPDNVIITFIYDMRQLPVFNHSTNIGIAVRKLPPSKTVVF